jgi:hypothetical protein
VPAPAQWCSVAYRCDMAAAAAVVAYSLVGWQEVIEPGIVWEANACCFGRMQATRRLRPYYYDGCSRVVVFRRWTRSEKVTVEGPSPKFNTPVKLLSSIDHWTTERVYRRIRRVW